MFHRYTFIVFSIAELEFQSLALRSRLVIVAACSGVFGRVAAQNVAVIRFTFPHNMLWPVNSPDQILSRNSQNA